MLGPKADDLALLPYTSGTTGRPKGCMHTHRTVGTALRASALWRGLGGDDRFFCAAPLFHLLGLQNGLNMPIMLGATSFVQARWDVRQAITTISHQRISYWAALPTMIIDFFGDPATQELDLGALRCLAGGGAPLPFHISERIRQKTGRSYSEAYGLTETASFLHGNPIGREKSGCLGLPTFDVSSLIIDPETLEELPDGREGELITSAPQIMLGYWNNPSADSASFIERHGRRYFRTGDLCIRDAEGYFFIRDRLKRMINAAGFKVWPAEVEKVLQTHPSVREACVVASPDTRLGDVVKAIVVIHPEARGQISEQQFAEWCRGELASYKVPRRVQFVESLPRLGTGKVAWRELQEKEKECPH